MSQTLQRSLLGLVLLLTVVAAVFAPQPKQAAVVGALPAVGPRERVAVEAHADPLAQDPAEVLGIRSRAEMGQPRPAFKPVSWAKPRQPVEPEVKPEIAAVVAAPEQAPALPFRVLGRYFENGETAVFLQHNERNLVVRVGDVLDGKYEIKSIGEGRMELVYLPLGTQQILDVGAAVDAVE